MAYPRHGQSHNNRTRLYIAWVNMKTRCYNPNDKEYPRYGARGISVCKSWRYSFEAFVRSVGAHPGPGWTLDRIDTHGNYRPGNVRWATRKTQNRNRRGVKLTLAIVRKIRNTRGLTQHQMATRFGVSQSTINKVLTGVSWR